MRRATLSRVMLEPAPTRPPQAPQLSHGQAIADRGFARAREPAASFALPHTAPFARKLAGRISRFVARHACTRPLALNNDAPIVSFTFDDVPTSACSLGAAVLEQHDARGTFYVAGGGCGATSPAGRLAGRDEIVALAVHGHEIGCHTYSHSAVSSIGQAELTADLERNRSFLQGTDGAITVRNFAYPYGDFSLSSKRHLQARFDSCRSLRRGVNEGVVDLGALKTCLLENASIDRQDILDFIARTVAHRGWLIFASHDVGSPPSRFGVTHDLLAFAVKAARDAGCRLTTIAGALATSGPTRSASRAT